MSNQAIIVRVEDTDIRISGRRMTDFPQAGTLVSFEKISGNATFIEGLNGTWTGVGSNGQGWRMTITLVQHSDDDVYMSNAIQLLKAGPGVLLVSARYGAVNTSSPGCIIETEPTREYAADGQPAAVYTITGTFPVGAGLTPLEAPTQLTEDQINNVNA